MINNMTKEIYSLTDFVKVFSHSYTVKAQASRRVRSFYVPPGIFWILTQFPKFSFLDFWIIETGYWPVPFSADEALQIGGLFPQGQYPRSGYGARRVQAIFQISTWKFFFYPKQIYYEKSDKFPISVDME